jgi:hypothetical protein
MERHTIQMENTQYKWKTHNTNGKHTIQMENTQYKWKTHNTNGNLDIYLRKYVLFFNIVASFSN